MKYLSIIFLPVLLVANTLVHVDGNGFHFARAGKGGMYPKAWLPERVEIPEGASTAWDAETMVLTVTTPPDTEEGEPTIETYTITETDITDALAYTPPPPPDQGPWTPLEFLGRFTPTEQAAIVDSTNTTVRIVYGQFLAAQEIIWSDLRTTQGMAALVLAEIITETRSDEILGVEEE
tara:strand:- start:1403 stop:1936 length:534 start_codon:yes stop_codon:yes gene_type:complete